jgi:hypothetical protein
MTTIVVPWRLAFVDEETITFNSIYYTIDVIFLIDIILNFLTSYLDEKS